MVHSRYHIENPFGAEFEKCHFQLRVAVQHAMADDRHESEVRRQGHADDMTVIDGAAEVRERWIAHPHMDAERQASAGEFVPDWQKTRIGKHSLAHSAEDNGGARTETLQFFDGFERLTLIAERQKRRPFEALGRMAALCGDVAVVSAK